MQMQGILCHENDKIGQTVKAGGYPDRGLRKLTCHGQKGSVCGCSAMHQILDCPPEGIQARQNDQ